MKKNNSKRKNIEALIGGDPEQMDRSQWNAALQRLFQKIKKTHKDPFEAKTILNEKLQEAFSKDFLQYDQHKDPKKQLSDVLSLYGLTPEQQKKIELEIVKGKGISRGGGMMGGGTWLKENPAFNSPEKFAKFYKKGEITPHILAYDTGSSKFPNLIIPHEAQHAADYFLYPEEKAYMNDEELIRLPKENTEENKQILKSIKEDPSLKNILFQSQSVEHFKPVYPLDPPGYYPHEFIYNKLHPYRQNPEVIPPEQPGATGIFAKEQLTPAITQDELYNALYNMDSGGYSTDPLKPNKFSKISKLFEEANKTKPASPKKSVSKSSIKPMLTPEEFDEMLFEGIDE